MDDPYSVKTTEVSVTTEDSNQNGIDLGTLERDGTSAGPSRPQHNAAYSVTISSTRIDRRSHSDLPLPPPPPPPPTTITVQAPPTRHGGRQKRRQNFEANNAAWSYTKCAILFFTAILITWIPSSANRVFSVIHSGEVSIPLEFMSAIVLPLQGFWNAVIYVTTSWSACKYFFSELGHRSRSLNTPKFTTDYTDKRSSAFRIPAQRSHKNYDTESMTELAHGTRPNSNEEPKR